MAYYKSIEVEKYDGELIDLTDKLSNNTDAAMNGLELKLENGQPLNSTYHVSI